MPIIEVVTSIKKTPDILTFLEAVSIPQHVLHQEHCLNKLTKLLANPFS